MWFGGCGCAVGFQSVDVRFRLVGARMCFGGCGRAVGFQLVDVGFRLVGAGVLRGFD
jgi:hypothetical protein